MQSESLKGNGKLSRLELVVLIMSATVTITPVLIIPFLIWACYEFAWKNAPEGVNPWLLTIPIFVGAAIGGLVGYHYHRKAVNAAQDILDEINN